MEAVVSCLRLALASCGQVQNINIERGLLGANSIVISAKLQSGPSIYPRAYEIMQLAKQALDAITGGLPTTSLISSRVQKEDGGYSLRSSFACLPEHAKDYMCWDMFRNGHCPRRGRCHWYHAQDADIARVKVNIRYGEELSKASIAEQPGATPSVVRHKISLGELVQ